MGKDIGWIKAWVEGKSEETRNFDDWDDGYYTAFREMEEMLQEVTKPELPTIPGVIAEYIKTNKKIVGTVANAFRLIHGMHASDNKYTPSEKRVRDYIQKWVLDNEIEFAIAWNNGYHEFDDLYRVILPENDSEMLGDIVALQRQENGAIKIARMSSQMRDDKSVWLTEIEINKNFHYLWELALPQKEVTYTDAQVRGVISGAAEEEETEHCAEVNVGSIPEEYEIIELKD